MAGDGRNQSKISFNFDIHLNQEGDRIVHVEKQEINVTNSPIDNLNIHQQEANNPATRNPESDEPIQPNQTADVSNPSNSNPFSTRSSTSSDQESNNPAHDGPNQTTPTADMRNLSFSIPVSARSSTSSDQDYNPATTQLYHKGGEVNLSSPSPFISSTVRQRSNSSDQELRLGEFKKGARHNLGYELPWDFNNPAARNPETNRLIQSPQLADVSDQSYSKPVSARTSTSSNQEYNYTEARNPEPDRPFQTPHTAGMGNLSYSNQFSSRTSTSSDQGMRLGEIRGGTRHNLGYEFVRESNNPASQSPEPDRMIQTTYTADMRNLSYSNQDLARTRTSSNQVFHNPAARNPEPDRLIPSPNTAMSNQSYSRPLSARSTSSDPGLILSEIHDSIRSIKYQLLGESNCPVGRIPDRPIQTTYRAEMRNLSYSNPELARSSISSDQGYNYTVARYPGPDRPFQTPYTADMRNLASSNPFSARNSTSSDQGLTLCDIHGGTSRSLKYQLPIGEYNNPASRYPEPDRLFQPTHTADMSNQSYLRPVLLRSSLSNQENNYTEARYPEPDRLFQPTHIPDMSNQSNSRPALPRSSSSNQESNNPAKRYPEPDELIPTPNIADMKTLPYSHLALTGSTSSDQGQKPWRIQRGTCHSLGCELLRVRAAAFCSEYKFKEASEKLEELKAIQKEDMGVCALLLVAEVSIQLGRKSDAKEAINDIVRLSMTSSSDVDNVVIFASDLIHDKSYVRALILLRIASDMHLLHPSLSPDDIVTGIGNCIEKMHEAVQPMINAGGNSKVKGIDYGLSYMTEMFEDLSAVKKVTTAVRAKHGARCAYWIGLNYSDAKEYERSINFFKSGVELLDCEFGDEASTYQFYGHLLSDWGMSCYKLSHYSEAEKCLQKALDAYDNASDYSNEDKKLKRIKQMQHLLKKSRGKKK